MMTMAVVLTSINYLKALCGLISIGAGFIAFSLVPKDWGALQFAIKNAGALSVVGHLVAVFLDLALGTCFLMWGLLALMTWY